MGGLPQIILFAGILSLGGMLANLGRSDVQEISFQHFKTHLLAQGLVEKVEVANKTSAKVYVRAGSARCDSRADCQCMGAYLQWYSCPADLLTLCMRGKREVTLHACLFAALRTLIAWRGACTGWISIWRL